MIRFRELYAINVQWTAHHMLTVCFQDNGKCEILSAGYVCNNYGHFEVCSFEGDRVYIQYHG